jgi:citrate lyase beta subunit
MNSPAPARLRDRGILAEREADATLILVDLADAVEEQEQGNAEENQHTGGKEEDEDVFHMAGACVGPGKK